MKWIVIIVAEMLNLQPYCITKASVIHIYSLMVIHQQEELKI